MMNPIKIVILEKGKQALENFISNPCEKTLKRFLNRNRKQKCILELVIKTNAGSFGDAAFTHIMPTGICPLTCRELASKRVSKTGFFGCSTEFLIEAWRSNPGFILLNLIELNSYVDTLKNKNTSKLKTLD
jgi:hypothetical protein